MTKQYVWVVANETVPQVFNEKKHVLATMRVTCSRMPEQPKLVENSVARIEWDNGIVANLVEILNESSHF